MTSFVVVAGSYEKLLFGVEVSVDSEAAFKPLFIYPSHIGAIQAVASGGRFLASGGADEVVRFVTKDIVETLALSDASVGCTISKPKRRLGTFLSIKVLYIGAILCYSILTLCS